VYTRVDTGRQAEKNSRMDAHGQITDKLLGSINAAHPRLLIFFGELCDKPCKNISGLAQAEMHQRSLPGHHMLYLLN
jgi:hypothetical protein